MNSIKKRCFALGLAAVTFLAISSGTAAATPFVQINIASNIPGLAQLTDPNLINPWGLSFTNASPFWSANQGTGTSTLYNANGTPNPLVVTVPTTPPPPGPTGTAAVGGLGFNMSAPTGGTAAFVFATLGGTIDAWRGAMATDPNLARIEYDAPDGAVYTGLTNGTTGGLNRLYAADAFNNKIDVFDSNFDLLPPSGFVDPTAAADQLPVFNVQNVGGLLYVEYAPPPFLPQDRGYVNVFNTNGTFVRTITDSHFKSPWGITLAPLTFPDFGGDLLFGNFGDGTINAFDVVTGAFQGTLADDQGNPFVNTGLWALAFRSAASGFNPNALYFTAGINGERDGLFGAIVPTPEPATLSLLGLGLAGLVARRRTRKA